MNYIRFIIKRTWFFLFFIKSRLKRQRFFTITCEGVEIKLTYFTPYHCNLAYSLSQSRHEGEILKKWANDAKHSSTIIDVGAFTGVYGLLAAKANPTATVYLYEPDPINAAHVLGNIQLNHLTNCHLITAAVTDHDGFITFNCLGMSASSIKDSSPKSPLVQAATLANTPADLIKLDAEGEESAILGTITSSPIIYLEEHNWTDHKLVRQHTERFNVEVLEVGAHAIYKRLSPVI